MWLQSGGGKKHVTFDRFLRKLGLGYPLPPTKTTAADAIEKAKRIRALDQARSNR